MNIKSQLAHFSSVIKLYQLLINYGGQVRFIGGAVRDIIIGKEVADIDLATNLLPEKIESILQENQLKYFSIGKEFGTITALINEQKIEITTLRKDINCDGRYAKVIFTDNWQEDAQRRDFTINALSADLDGNIYDYFDGIRDLKQRKVRFIGEPELRIREDYLRILRFFRFSAYFADQLDQDGLKWASKYSVKLKNLSGERIRSELSKIFLAPNSLNILATMEEHHIFQSIIPISRNSITIFKKLYAIAHDLQYKINELICYSSFLRQVNQDKANKIITNFAFNSEQQKTIIILNSAKIEHWDYANLKRYYQQYKQLFKQVIILNLAESNADIVNHKDLKNIFNLTAKPLPIKGSDLLKLNIKPGKQMGKLLLIADQIWFDHEFKLSKEEILEEIVQYVNKF